MNLASAPLTVRAAWEALRGASPITWFGLIALLVVSAVFRGWLILAASPTLVSDARDYHDYAASLLEGRGYVQIYRGETAAFDGFEFRAFRPPGYPFLLAGLYRIVGWHPRAALLLNVMADLATQVAAALIAVVVLAPFGPLRARLAAIITVALLGLHVLWTPALLTEPVYTALFTTLGLLLLTRTGTRSIRGALLNSVLLMAALFIRPVTLCLFPLFVVQVLRAGPSRSRIVLLGALLVPALLAVAAWSGRNYLVFGEFVPLTTNLGHHNAWDFGIPADQAYEIGRAEGLNEAQINRVLLQAIGERIREKPAGFAQLLARRIGELFSFAPPPELTANLWTLTFDSAPTASLPGRVYRQLYSQYPLVYGLATLGLLVLLVRKAPIRYLLATLVAYIVFQVLLSRGDIRFLAPIYPLMCVLAAALFAFIIPIRSRSA